MTRYAVLVSLVAFAGPARADDPTAALKKDAEQLQGKWEQVSNSDVLPVKMKVVKEVRGDTETVSRYTADGKLFQAARATIKLSATGTVRVLTFSDREVTEGLGKGRKQAAPASYIYRLDGDELYEVGGLLPDSPFAKDVPYLIKWRRVTAAAPAAAVTGDMKATQGTWTFASQEADGVSVPAEFLKPLKVVMDGDKFAVVTAGRDDPLQAGTVTIDSSKSPKEIDVVVTSGGDKGGKWLGIYKLDGDTITFCFDPAGKKRPAEFKAEKGSGYFMNVHKRAK